MLITGGFGSANTGADVYYTILNADKTVYQARTNVGVTEIVPSGGAYGVQVSDTVLAGRTVLWDIDGTNKCSSETFIISDIASVITAISNIPTAAGIGTASGQITVTDEYANLVADAQVWITSDVSGHTIVAGPLITPSDGEVVFYLDAGVTYYIWTSKDGINFTNPRTIASW